jgi:hypothetical protein
MPQRSLRDSTRRGRVPNAEALGYSHMSPPGQAFSRTRLKLRQALPLTELGNILLPGTITK